MGRFGLAELGLIALILLILFGANRLPQIARAIGQSIKEFKKSISCRQEEENRTNESDSN